MMIRTVDELDRVMTEPSDDLVRDLNSIDGDILILGAGGKMGPTLAMLAANAVTKGGSGKKVIAVSRFSEEGLREQLEASGVQTISCDLLNDADLQRLPKVKNVIYMAGMKFGTTGNEALTWAMNAYLPGRVAEAYKDSRIVVFSTGNVYPFTPVAYGGAGEDMLPAPVGEYGQSCLGRERIFEFFSKRNGTPVLIYRLNYAIDLRYGVLLEIAKSVKQGRPVDVTMGSINCIWQGDANEIALRSLTACTAPANFLNVTGPETVSVRWAAEQFAARFGTAASFSGVEAESALLSNASKSVKLFGYPKVPLLQMIDWIAAWVETGGKMSNKPTHFQEREGKF